MTTTRTRLRITLRELKSASNRVPIPATVLRFAQNHKAAEASEAEIRRYEEQRRRWKEEDRQREEAKREEAFEAEVARWRRAQDIRDYVRAALAALDAAEATSDGDQSERDRLRWALAYADRIDPLCG